MFTIHRIASITINIIAIIIIIIIIMRRPRRLVSGREARQVISKPYADIQCMFSVYIYIYIYM